MRLKNPAVGDVDPLFSALLELFGYKANAKVFSKEGIASLLGAACLVLVLLMGLYLVVRIRRVETLPWRLLVLFFVCTLVLNTVVFLLTKTTLALYYIPIFIYFVPLLAVWLGQCKRAFPPLWCGRPGRGRLFREQPSHHALLCQKTAGFPDCLQRARLYRKGHGGASDTGRRLPAG